MPKYLDTGGSLNRHRSSINITRIEICTRNHYGYLPPYSPDFNPIEMAFSKLKALLRKAAARTIDDLWDAIAKGVDQFTPDECKNYFQAAGYDPD